MKKILKIILGIVIFIISFICVDGLCARFLDTKPIVSLKEEVIQGGSIKSKIGYVYKSIFADVYYCDTIYEDYDEDNNLIREDGISRHYVDRGSNFDCPVWINEKDDIYESYREEAIKYRNMEYMKIDAKGLYESNFGFFMSTNKKLGSIAVNYLGDYYVDSEYFGIYLFDTDNFDKEPVKLEIGGYDIPWRVVGSVSYSKSGNIMVFEYFCGYRPDQWMGEQKYNEEDCKKNNDHNGINVFKVNGINDYEFYGYFPDSRNQYIDEYKDSYFHIHKILDDENIIIKYTVTNNKHGEPYMEVYYKWNIVDDTHTLWQVWYDWR